MLDILVVDDEPGIRAGLAEPLADAGHRVTEAVDGAAALKLIAERVFDVVITDVRLPKVDGLTLLRRLQEDSPSTTVILMTGHAKVADAVTALKEGAYDYVTKPFVIDDFPMNVIERLAAERALSCELRQAREQLKDDVVARSIIGRSPPMVRLLDRIHTIAQSEAPVLITGESGTGKELIAHALHERSARANRPFVAINCAALPEALLEAELFGHERGAFTGAVKKRDGRFMMANGGTLFLDEIAEISPAAQAKLLRVLQEGTIEPIGTNTSVHVDVRIISATHQNLKERIADGRFREDLYYRLNVLDVRIPPLRERPGDLLLLFEHYLQRFTPEGRKRSTISARAWAKLASYPFPGNVREFAHAVERAVVLACGGEIDFEHLPADVVGTAGPRQRKVSSIVPLTTAAKEFEREYLLQALEVADGKRGRAAELLGISRKNLWEKLRAHGIGHADSDDDSELESRAES